MMVNPNYNGNKLQYQTLKENDNYSENLDLTYAVGTVHPENIFSINNLLMDDFVLIRKKEFSREIRNIYLKQLII